MGTKTSGNQLDDDVVLPPIQTLKRFDVESGEEEEAEKENKVPEDVCASNLTEANKFSLSVMKQSHKKCESNCLVEVDPSNSPENEKKCDFGKSYEISSLVYQQCKLVEQDAARQKALFFGISNALHEKKLVGDTSVAENFEDIKNKYIHSLYHLYKIADTSEIITPSRTTEENRLLPQNIPSAQNIFVWSRYAREFDEISYIARGGFGFVYRAKNKLDGTEYAVKKINLRFNSVEDFHKSLLEVKLLARMHHPNIIDYKAAWLEPFHAIFTPNYCRDIDDSSLSSFMHHETDKKIFTYLTSNSQISNETSNRKSWCPSTTKSTPSTEEKAICLYTPSEEKVHRRYRHLAAAETDCATLYIQMKLYDQTLQQWLKNRNEKKIPVNVRQCLTGFMSLVSGIEYIHSMGVIHHDIKPSNIFVNRDLTQVQVGDFGLACLLQHSHQDLTVLSKTFLQAGHPNMGIGTRQYAAPEQLKGVCNMKSDIYSLGIILVELLQPFNTEMEKSVCIERLKAGEVSNEICIRAPKLVKMLLSLTSPTMENRPTAKQLLIDLQLLMYNFKDISSAYTTIGLLLHEINQRDREIKKLKNEKIQSNEEIKSLKQKLERLEQSTSVL